MRNIKLGFVGWAIAISTIILFASSSLRHALFQSNAWDLGIFDQAVYLISQGQSPFSSFLGFHILGDHAALIFYPLALLYQIYPHVSWLLAVQAVALSLGALPTWYLARHAGVREKQATTIAVVYLLYPLIFNINLFDFHPEVIALPSILGVILAARLGHLLWFCLGIIVILSCKAVLSLTVAAMGFWLLVFEKKNFYGAIALVAGIAWFIIATGLIIPFFGNETATVARHLFRYSYLGSSFIVIVKNLIQSPWLLLQGIFTLANLEYLILLLIPVIWGIAPTHLIPLIGAIPCLTMNILADSLTQKNLVHQYSLTVLPFLILVVISTLAAGKGLLKTPRVIILWSLITFLALAKFGYFASLYLQSLHTWQATREAIALVQTKGSILTGSEIAPHLTHRPVVKLATEGSESVDLNQFEYVLLNVRHPGWASSRDTVMSLVAKLKQMPQFRLSYQRDEVVLFERL